MGPREHLHTQRMALIAGAPETYLFGDEIIESRAAPIEQLAQRLRSNAEGPTEFARTAFEWVRDEVAHSADAGDSTVTLTATEALSHRVGLCFAKSHLLAALLRAQSIPAGLCYQRLRDGERHVLHGLVAVHLEDAWHRQDPRGNVGGIDAQFSLAEEQLAYTPNPDRGEMDYQTVFATPAPSIVDALREATDALRLCAGGLPSSLS